MSFKEKLKKFFTPIDLRQGKEWKVLLKFSLPVIVSYLLQQIYTISDAAICGQTLSADEVAGVNDVSSILFIFLQFAFGCTAGFTVIISDRVGNADADGIRRSFATQIILCAVITVVLTAVSMLSLKPMLKWINVTPANEGVYNAAYAYCMVIFVGIFAQMFYNFICSVLRSIGDSVTPLVFLFISTLINIGLDLLFIAVFKWGVIGAAAATVIAQALSTVACFIYTFVKFKSLRLKRGDFKAGLGEYFAHLKQGLPLGLQFSVLAIGLIVLQSGVVSFDLKPDGTMVAGNPAQNGYGAACKLGGFLMAPMNAFGTALVSFNAQNYGAREFDRIKRGTLQSMVIITVFYIILAGLGLLLTINGAYLKLFLSADKINEQSIKFGNYYLYVACSLYFFLGILFVWRSAAQGIEKPFFTLLAGTFELVARILVCLYLPAAINGGPINSEASLLSYVALCSADPFAWLGSVLALTYPFIAYICLKRYKLPPEENQY
ncbi:MAG: polysaccharide biosynthesis C-terminal domain-containing protein [Clostridia bacterium]|nr:polysaccharide biosynthesis C-terminal domain-containing protein [Clostridia bacterium]